MGLLLVAGVVLCALMVRPLAYGLPMAGIVLALAMLYNLAAKQVPVLGAVVLALVRASHACFALLILGDDHLRMAFTWGEAPAGARALLAYPLIIGCYTFGLSMVAELEDRPRRGSRLAHLVGAGAMAVALLGALSLAWQAPWRGWISHGTGGQVVGALFGWAVVVGSAAWLVWKVGRRWWAALLSCRCRDVGPVTGAALGGMILIDAIAAAAGHPAAGLLCLLMYGVFLGVARLARMG
jgi:4-hydroxybenzoate polyprenyltransferase